MEVQEILERLQGPGAAKVPAKDLKLAAVAASRVRREFLRDAWDGLGKVDPKSPEFQAYKEFLKILGELFMKHGFVVQEEMQLLFKAIEELERS